MIELDHEGAGLDLDTEHTATYLADMLERYSLGQKLFTLGVYVARAAGQREADRVAAMHARDRLDADREAERNAAIIQVADGLTVNIGNTVVQPTPEWMSKGETRSVAVGGERWTDMPMTTVRRVSTSQIFKIHIDGRINERQFKACAWYRDRHELSGLEGNLRSGSMEPRVACGLASSLPFSTSQIEAQDELRNARLIMPRVLHRFFEKVVVDDLSLTRAAREAHAGKSAIDSFRHCADRVADYVEYSTGKHL